MVTKQIKHKTEDGKEVVLDLGALAKNVTEDEERRFVSDTEKTDWNAKLDGDGNGSNLEAAFTQAESRSNLTSGEKHSTIFGKIAKWFADLKNHAFADLIQNATTADTTRAVSAAVAKNLQDQISVLNTDMAEYLPRSNIIVEDVTVAIAANTNFSYVAYKAGYLLVSAVGTTFDGVYANGIANTGSNYAVFYNTQVSQQSEITLSLLWIQIY